MVSASAHEFRSDQFSVVSCGKERAVGKLQFTIFVNSTAHRLVKWDFYGGMSKP